MNVNRFATLFLSGILMLVGAGTALAQNRMAESIALDPRLEDPTKNRCVGAQSEVPPEKCSAYQDKAYKNGMGCITTEEYNWARMNAVAPLCDPFEDTMYLGWCRCGCFEVSTVVTAFDRLTSILGPVPVDEITVDRHAVSALSEESSIDVLDFAPRKLTATTAGGEDLPLVWVHLANATSIGLSTEHAVLLSTGRWWPPGSLTPPCTAW
jgi:hypothetical protein